MLLAPEKKKITHFLGNDMSELKKEIVELLNEHNRKNNNNSSDLVLTEYLVGCLEVFGRVVEPRVQSLVAETSSPDTDTTETGQFITDRRKLGDRRHGDDRRYLDNRRLLDNRRNSGDRRNPEERRKDPVEGKDEGILD